MTEVLPPPRLLGPYCLLRPLAEGGMGAVHIATALDEPGDRLCLIKTLKPGMGQNSDEYLRRFLDEARVAVRLTGEHLCHVFDAGEADGELFLAMELIEGITFLRLAERCGADGVAVPVAQALTLGIGLLKGLYAAHAACDPQGRPLGVVHRDVSPQNVMVDRFGRVKVIDFGLATSTLKETVTEQAVVMGKMAYMAPEQARGDPVTAAADQYAAAVVLYELLTGDRYYGDLPSRGIWGIVGAGTHQPRCWAQVPAKIAPILSRALAPTSEARWPDCHAFASALADLSPSTTATRQRELATWIGPLLAGELTPIDEARARLLELPSGLRAGVKEATERVRVRLHGTSSVPLRRPALAPSEATEATRIAPTPPARSVAGPSPVSRSRRPVMALVVAGALVVGGVVVVAGLRTTPRPNALPLSPPTTSIAAPPPVTPPLSPPPLSPPHSPPHSPPPLAPPAVAAPAPTPTPPTPTPTRPDKELAELRERALRLEASCTRPCVGQVVKIVRGLKVAHERPAAARLLGKCEDRCRP